MIAAVDASQARRPGAGIFTSSLKQRLLTSLQSRFK